MRKQPVRIVLFGLGLALLPCILASAEEPTDPKALMLAALKLNNLTTEDAKPWHIKASFQLFDDQGAVTDEGTYEEFWASPFQFKRVFAGKNFSQTAYGGKAGILLSEVHGDTPDLLLAARNNLVNPLPPEAIIEHTTYTTKPLDAGNLKLTCVIPSASTPGAPADNSAYCLNQDEPLLRIAARPSTSDQTFHNKLIRVEGRVIAGDLKITHDGKATVTVHVETASVLDPSEEAVFAPPADAVPEPLRTLNAPGVTPPRLKYSVEPVYPRDAHSNHISGEIYISAIIGKDGKPREVHAVRGPKELQMSAIEAVNQYRFWPALLNGKPVDVQMTVQVNFNLQ
ncbi:energy transducer TonB [Terracidiphilus gabretensis]|uniref:energy transducer TonB n=1 Tax=Terracidiphilus gabretensis TaxID=1577687 RepID=UPI00071B0BC4|nr:energy transducer TonB [Terracidiphilus gabretensis]